MEEKRLSKGKERPVARKWGRGGGGVVRKQQDSTLQPRGRFPPSSWL